MSEQGDNNTPGLTSQPSENHNQPDISTPAAQLTDNGSDSAVLVSY